jgi:hypothetical protein
LGLTQHARNNGTHTHPGEILADELEEIGRSAKNPADVIEVPPNRFSGSLRKADHHGGHGARAVLRHVGRLLDEPAERL